MTSQGTLPFNVHSVVLFTLKLDQSYNLLIINDNMVKDVSYEFPG